MRRVLLLCLLCLLPFQGAWAVVAGIAAFDAPCAASQPATGHGDHGDHGSEADASAGVADAGVDCDGGLSAGPCCDVNCSSCSACQGHGLVALVGLPHVLGSTGTGRGVLARDARGAPDHVPEQPLRPPLPRLA